MKRYFFAAILFTLIAVPVIWKIQQNQDRMIIEHHLLAEDFAKNHGTPPGVAISTVFFGPFRNLMVNALWLRMDRLHKQGKYFEMVQLADWILQVQPENATAAQYVAWNMAYNITVTQQDFDTRHRWIRKAVETLHKAIAKNPNEPILYREMGWIWQHKLGDELDQASPYYKQKIAEENYRIFGKKHAPDWQRLTELPADWKSLYQKYPALRSVCSGREEELEKAIRTTGELPANLALNEENRTLLTEFVRGQVIRNWLFIDPGHALWVEKEYGKLDWLLPEAFAIYWSSLGMKKIPVGERSTCIHVLTQSLKVMFTNGRILFAGGEPGKDFIRLPNFALVDSVFKVYKWQAELISGGLEFSGYYVFLQDAVEAMYLYGKKKEAAKYYKMMQEETPAETKDLTMEEYVRNRLRSKLKVASNRQLQYMVSSFILQGIFAFANGETDDAHKMLDTAEMVYNIYKKEHSSAEEQERLRLPPFKEFKRNVVDFVFANFPALSPALKAELELQENNAPPVEK